MIAALRQKISAFFADVAAIFIPPFDGLPIIVGCYFVLSYIALPFNPTWRGDLPDPDDYTYLTQTLDWLQGQSWFDNIQHRMSPPEGVAIHYTRFAELPMAGLILLFRAFHYSWHGAALLTSFLLPVIYLCFLFAALRWAASKLIAPDWARLTAFIALFGGALTYKFAPGQVDHHGLEAILTIIAVGLTAQIFARPERLSYPIAAAAILALSLAIALEVLPWVALIAAALGLWATAQGRVAARAIAVFAVTLFVSSAALLALDRAPADILQPDLLSYSIAYVVLTGGITLALIAAAAFTRIENIKPRFTLSAIVALTLAALYLHHFPALLAGPYGAMDKRLAELFFANLQEAVAIVKNYSLYEIILHFTPMLIAFGTCAVLIRTAPPPQKWAWGLIAALILSSGALALFYQIRVLVYAQLFEIIPLAAFVQHGWNFAATHYQGRRRFWAEIGLILVIGPLTAIFLPALSDGRPFNTGVMLFPAQSFDDNCQMGGLEKLLGSPPYADRKPLRMMNMIDTGPELLFRTPHAIMSAPYHTNLRGNLDALDFFATADADQAHEIAKRDGIDLVVLCREIPNMYLTHDGPHYIVMPNGQERMRPDPGFAGQLVQHKVPDWLNEVPVPASNYLLFEIKK